MEMSGAKRVVVTTEPDPLQVRALTEALRPDVLQVHSLMTPSGLQILRKYVPEIWALVPVGLGKERKRLMELTGSCDGIVLDTASCRGGGSGKTHDWDLSAGLRMTSPLKVVLAGGLGPENVAKAVRTVRPDVIDVSSGIERAGRKDPLLFSQMVSEIRRVDDEQR
jgi:phosphoribosylanthranilate isomerase